MSAVLQPRREPGKWASMALAASVHAVLLGLLIYGIRWQTRPPAAVEVELVRALPSAPAVQAPPEPAPRPRPEPERRPAPPPPKPDIAVKEKEKPKPPKAEPPPREEPLPKFDPLAQLKQEEERLAQRKEAEAAERQLRQLTADQASAGRNKAMADYTAKIRGKIKGNIVLPLDIQGNPEAVFDVVQLPGGEIFTVKLKKSSGHAGYDAAVERAILKSSPLPKPERSELFVRNLELKFRPVEEE